jgi:phosphinothricin acetyltransferase
MEHSVHLTEAARGKGLGRALMAVLEDHARQGGAHLMIAGISGENPGAQAFHAALGYAHVARIPEAGWKWGRYIDLVLMQKILS